MRSICYKNSVCQFDAVNLPLGYCANALMRRVPERDRKIHCLNFRAHIRQNLFLHRAAMSWNELIPYQPPSRISVALMSNQDCGVRGRHRFRRKWICQNNQQNRYRRPFPSFYNLAILRMRSLFRANGRVQFVPILCVPIRAVTPNPVLL